MHYDLINYRIKGVKLMINIKNLCKTFYTNGEEKEVLKNISINIEDGEIYGLIGLSGAGKSSLLRCINLLEKPTSGEVIVNGANVESMKGVKLRDLRRQIGMIFQQFNLLNSSTVYENIAFPLRISNVPKSQIDKRVMELLEIVELTDKKDAYPSKLSGGQKQRVGIARALANNPSILLLDEATSALDPSTTNSILELLKSINSNLNITMIVVTHEMAVIKKLCSRVAVIEDGSIVEEGQVVDIFSNPSSKTVQRFLNEVIPELPKEKLVQEDSRSSKTVMINFLGEDAEKPFISDMVKHFDISANILSGNIEIVQNLQIGRLIINISGNKDNVTSALHYLLKNNLRIEVLENGSFKPYELY